jgi:hypothetical protein
MTSVAISPPNAIVFVLDPANKKAVIPEYLAGNLIAATETCVSVGTQDSVDGETQVTLKFDDSTLPFLHPIFSGAVATPNGKIAIVTAELQRVLELDVPTEKVSISIWVDDLQNPARVIVIVAS